MDRKQLEQREGELEAKGQLSAVESKELEDIKAKLAAMDDEDEDPPVSVTARIPESTWSEVSRAAKQSKRSRNSIVNEALQKYLAQPDNGGSDEVRDLSALLQVLPESDVEMRSAVRAKLAECLSQKHGISVLQPEPPQPSPKTPGVRWNAMTVANRTALLKSAKYKPETVAKFAGKKWGEMDKDAQRSFARLMAVDAESHESEDYVPERDGERRKSNQDRRNMWDGFFGIKGKPPKGTAERRMGNRRGAKEARVQ